MVDGIRAKVVTGETLRGALVRADKLAPGPFVCLLPGTHLSFYLIISRPAVKQAPAFARRVVNIALTHLISSLHP
jgi:hypothetical protein